MMMRERWAKIKSFIVELVVREPAIGLIKWLRPKGLKMCSYVESVLNSKFKLLKISAGTQKCYMQRNTPG